MMKRGFVQLWRDVRGQYTIYALFMTIITLIAYVAVYPVLTQVISDAGITGIEGTILSLSPLFILLAILLSAMWYVYPYREE
ncbi:MAG: hypothetical protein DRN18_00070 [Thermoplasmata archaeon]|nr:MAG: hypothetical protein DRN18_00070 [Thermoplasmata archaeon]